MNIPVRTYDINFGGIVSNIVTRAEQVSAFVELSTGRPVPVPAEFVAQYNEMK